MKILLNGKERLEELFAEIDSTRYTEALKSKVDDDPILPGFGKMVKEQALPGKVIRMITMSHILAKSN